MTTYTNQVHTSIVWGFVTWLACWFCHARAEYHTRMAGLWRARRARCKGRVM